MIEGGGVLSHGICQRPTTVRGVSFMCSSSISSRWRRRTGPLDGRDRRRDEIDSWASSCFAYFCGPRLSSLSFRVPGEGLCHCFSSAPRRRHTSVVARRVGANLAAHPPFRRLLPAVLIDEAHGRILRAISNNVLFIATFSSSTSIRSLSGSKPRIDPCHVRHYSPSFAGGLIVGLAVLECR